MHHLPRAALGDAVRPRRPGRRQRCRDLAGQPLRHACRQRRADRDPPRRLGLVRRSDPLPRDRLRCRRSSHAHGGPGGSAAACRGRPFAARRARRRRRASRRPSASGRAALHGQPRAHPCRAGAAWPADPVRACARAAGAVGRVDVASPPTRWRSRRRRPALRSTGARCMPGSNAASVLPRSPTPPASPRRAIPCSTCNCRSTSPIAFPPGRRRRSSGPGRMAARIIAIGTTVVRALEAAANGEGVRAGYGVAHGRIEQ